MCAEEQIPGINRINDIRTILEVRSEQSEEGVDIFALDRGVYATPDEIIAAGNWHVNHTDPSTIRRDLEEARRISIPLELEEDYDNIFLVPGLTRRRERPFPDPVLAPPVEYGDLMFQWINMCLDDHTRIGDFDEPDNMELFDNLLKHFLPARLDLNTWVAREMMVVVGLRMTGQYGFAHELQPYRPWMNFSHPTATRIDPNGRVVPHFAFLGEPRVGRLVWVPHNGHPHPFTMEEYREYHEIRAKLRTTELALIALARRIAGRIAANVVEKYAIPQFEMQGRPLLDRRQIGRAVREILGEEWFDLPFDVDDDLLNWSEDEVLKSDKEIIDGESAYIDEYDDLEALLFQEWPAGEDEDED